MGKRVYDESKSFKTRKEAAAEYVRMKASLEAGTYTAPSTMTVTEYFERHWLPSIKSRVKVSTFDGYERIYRRHIKPGFGATRLQGLTPMHLDTLYARLGEPRTVPVLKKDGTEAPQSQKALSAKTIRNVHLMIASALADAVDSDLLSRNPASRAKPPRVIYGPDDEIQAWDQDELRAFLDKFRKDPWYPKFRLAAMTGMRRAEVLGLRWKDIDFEKANLTVRQALLSTGYKTYFDSPKSHRPRTIDLDPKTLKMLKRLKASQNAMRLAYGPDYLVSSLVFTNEDGSLVHPDSFSQAFERLVAQTSLQRITLHGLRHTHATLLLKAGVPVNVVSERLGHADPGFTLRRYAHVLPSMQAEAALKITKLVDG